MANGPHMSRQPIYALHGWGFGPGVWSSISIEAGADIGANVGIEPVALSGYAENCSDPLSLDKEIERLYSSTASGSTWVAWSMGGLVALALAARYPHHIKKLILVACTPKFALSEIWPHGIGTQALADFGARCDASIDEAMDYFISLVSHGDMHGRMIRCQLKQLRDLQTPPAQAALERDLSLLQDADLRVELGALQCPVLLIIGANDALVPASVAVWCGEINPRIQTVILPDLGHAPFLSDPALFIHHVRRFHND